MKKSIAMRWVKELESGDWQQGTGCLDKDGKQCCLGVLSLMAACEGVCEIDGTNSLGPARFGDTHETEMLPQELLLWSGMKTDSGVFHDGSVEQQLTDLNDIEKLSFKDIAAIIRKNWKKL